MCVHVCVYVHVCVCVLSKYLQCRRGLSIETFEHKQAVYSAYPQTGHALYDLAIEVLIGCIIM